MGKPSPSHGLPQGLRDVWQDILRNNIQYCQETTHGCHISQHVQATVPHFYMSTCTIITSSNANSRLPKLCKQSHVIVTNLAPTMVCVNTK